MSDLPRIPIPETVRIYDGMPAQVWRNGKWLDCKIVLEDPSVEVPHV